ncbi:unnamed protein product [Closterium sp. Naga37s-1]|nr:unnamed protein product [Closterium sp. Naga37s-1]
MAPPEFSSVVHAPAAGLQEKKPLDAASEPVTPKTLFNGPLAPRGGEGINELTARTSALSIRDLSKGNNVNVNGNDVKAAGSSAGDGVLNNGKAKATDAEDEDGYLSDDPDECQDPAVLNEIAAQAGVAIALLVPFAWSKEIPCIIGTVKHLVKMWGKHMTLQLQVSQLTYVSSSPRAAASMKLSSAVKTLLADPAIAFISTGGVREEWLCAQEDCGKAHGASFEKAVEHVQSVRHGNGLLKAGAATRLSKGKQNLAQVRKDYGV